MPDNVASVRNLRILGGEASVGRISFPADNSPDVRKFARVGWGFPRQPYLASVGRRPPRRPFLASVERRSPRWPPLRASGGGLGASSTGLGLYKNAEFPCISSKLLFYII